MTRPTDFAHHTALVTGAASGIGRALAVELASRRVDLLLNSLPHETDALETLARDLSEAHGIRAHIHAADLLDPDTPDDLLSKALEVFGHLDILVNNAGVLGYGHFEDLDREAQSRIVRVNAESLMRMMHTILPSMISRKKGWILNISSISAFQPTPYHAVYGATKAFVQSLSEAVRVEVEPHGVTVSTLNPPYTRTPMLDGMPNLPLMQMMPMVGADAVARIGIDALARGGVYCVPHLPSLVINAWLTRLLPRKAVAWMGKKLLQPPRRG